MGARTVSEPVETSQALPQVDIRGLRKTYGQVVALEGASFSVRSGEFFTLLGPSGSGKTTLLALIAGLQLPDAGNIEIGGVDVTYVRPEKRQIGVVFQNYALFPHLTVAQNIAFPLEMRKIPRADVERKVARALEMVQLPHVAARLPSELSGGQQQRIALARCLVYEPKIVLMDEPLGALDKKLRLHMQTEIKRIHADFGVTVIYVTHDQEEALTMSDRICLMRNARIEQIGTPADLYFRPRSLFSADFLGESNLIGIQALEVSGATVVGRTAGGDILRAMVPADASFRSGQKLHVMVRPECVRALGPDENADNILAGSFRDRVLTGTTTRLTGGLPDGNALCAAVLTAPGAPRLRAGDPLRFGWSQDACIALADDEVA